MRNINNPRPGRGGEPIPGRFLRGRDVDDVEVLLGPDFGLFRPLLDPEFRDGDKFHGLHIRRGVVELLDNPIQGPMGDAVYLFLPLREEAGVNDLRFSLLKPVLEGVGIHHNRHPRLGVAELPRQFPLGLDGVRDYLINNRVMEPLHLPDSKIACHNPPDYTSFYRFCQFPGDISGPK